MPTLVVALTAFLFGFIGSMPLAGPVSVMVVSRAMVRAFRDALLLACGAAAAEGLYAGTAFFGFSAFLARWPIVLPISHGVTALVLFVVAIHFLRWRAKDAESEEQQKRPGRKRAAFFTGFTISALNPTLFVTWGAATAALYSRQLVTITSILAIPFGVAAALGVAAWNVAFVAILKRFGGKFPKAAVTWVIRVMALVLLAIAIWSAVDLVRWILRG